MAAAASLRWGLKRAGAWLLPSSARCPRRALHKQTDGPEFQSIYSLDKLYPESRGSDTAWRLPVSEEGGEEGEEGAFPRRCRGTSACRGRIGRAGANWSRGQDGVGGGSEQGRGRGTGPASSPAPSPAPWRPGSIQSFQEHHPLFRVGYGASKADAKPRGCQIVWNHLGSYMARSF